jgi:hypothetical protein
MPASLHHLLYQAELYRELDLEFLAQSLRGSGAVGVGECGLRLLPEKI